jgi:hypothetical protein
MNQVLLTPETRQRRFTLSRFAAVFQWSLAGLLTVSWIVLHLRFFLHAGALWRDEVNSVNLCNSPRISEVFNNLQYDSFPLLWHLILRFWIRIGIGTTDRGIRLLGLVTGLGILATLWANARRFRFPTPIATLTLLGFTSVVVSWGDSIRGFGPGVLLALLTLGFMWDVAMRPSALRITLALITALASVQDNFYNTVILLAICCGAAAVALRRRKFIRILTIGAIGLVCAASMTPYRVLVARSAGFRYMMLHPQSLPWLYSRFVDSVGYDPQNPIATYTFNDRMWEIAIFGALAVALLALLRFGENPAAPSTPDELPNPADSRKFRMDVLTYHLTILLVGVLGYWAFLNALSYAMHAWYFLSLLALVAACVDGLFGSSRSPVLRSLLCLGAIYYCAATAQADWYDAGLRKTNINLICDRLSRIEKPNDLVVISPFFYGITYQRYDKGPARFVAVPGIDFLAYCKLDLLNKPIHDPNAMNPILDQITEVLRSGHSVYLVGDYLYPRFDKTPPATIREARDPAREWNAGPLLDWPQQIADLLLLHAKNVRLLDTPVEGITGYERPAVRVATGWTDTRSP